MWYDRYVEEGIFFLGLLLFYFILFFWVVSRERGLSRGILFECKFST